MVFPQTPLPIKGEMLIDGTWTTMTSDIRLDESVVITRGRSNEQGRIGPSKCNFKLNNRDGKYSNRNPMSPYYRLLPLNTLFRVSVTGTTTFMDLRDSQWGAYDPDVDPVYSSAPRAYTSDKAALDITGDIDVRIDIEPDYWNPDNTRGVTLCGKYRNTASDNRSWALTLNTRGFPRFYWSEDGINFTGMSGSTVDHMMPRDRPRRALRCTMDVNNGSGGKTVRFYVADTIAGPWTQIGADVTASGTTSIYNGTARLEVGSIDDGDESELSGNNGFVSYDSFVGKVYGMQVYDGIGGTLVANFDPTSRTAGDTSWSDGLGNTWTLVAPAEITADNRRFIGEMSAFPQYWDTTGNDIYVRTTASGIIRRLTQGAPLLKSPVYRNISQYNNIGYWPMEDDVQATRASSAVKGSSAATINDITFGFDETFPGSAGVARINSSASRIIGRAKFVANADAATFTIYFKYPSLVASDTTLVEFFSTGTLNRWTIQATSGGGYRLRGYNPSRVVIYESTAASGAAPQNEWTVMRVQLTKNGSNVDVLWQWYGLLDPVVNVIDDPSAYSGFVGKFVVYQILGTATNADLAVAHIFIGQTEGTINESGFLQSSNAFVDEAAGVRFRRLCREEGVPFEIVGDPNETEPMGPQRIDTFMNLIYETADVDGGFVFESRHMAGIGFRGRKSLYNQHQVELDYAANHLTGQLQPTDDDQNIRNKVTVNRPFGGSAVSEVTEGPYSTQEPPDGVGVYEAGVQLNASSDDRLEVLAQHQTSIGTWDELRYPSVQVNLERQPFIDDTSLAEAIGLLDIGAPIVIVNMPSWLPPDDVMLLIQGYREVLANKSWEFVWNTTPYGMYVVNDLTQSDLSVFRAAATDSRLSADITSSAMSFNVKTPTGALWGTTAGKPQNFPLDIVIGGELIEISGISGTSSPQTFTVSQRSKNGVVKAHSTDDDVQVAKPFRAAL